MRIQPRQPIPLAPFQFRVPSLRVGTAIIVFVTFAYAEGTIEGHTLPLLMHWLRDSLHVDFHSIFGPKPSVPVNTLTLICLYRSAYSLLITWFALSISRCPWSEYGFAWTRSCRYVLSGLVTGFVAISLLIAMMWLSGALTFDGLKLHGALALEYGLRWLFGLLLVGIAEECMNRAYILVALARGLGLVTAVLLTSFSFAMAHAGNPGETFAGLLQVYLFGTVCALSVLRTGSVWWAAAFHGAWNWTQEYFYGTLGSGYWYDGHLFQFHPRGNPLLSGSSVGPEGSVYVFVVLGFLLAHEVYGLGAIRVNRAKVRDRGYR